MKEQIVTDPFKQALAEILAKTTAGVEKGISFLNAELPDVGEQLLAWKMWESLLYCISTLLFIIVVFSIPLIIAQKYKTFWKQFYSMDLAPIGVLITMIYIVLSGLISYNLFDIDWLQILVAPKIYLIEYAAELLK